MTPGSASGSLNDQILSQHQTRETSSHNVGSSSNSRWSRRAVYEEARCCICLTNECDTVLPCTHMICSNCANDENTGLALFPRHLRQ